ncbi:hypothetical protein B0G71_7708 [Paraburkholderia sp. BL27I4N3]|uniref:hypothetical protein n=1 Tax=Paraburkholderia sp. BL27I4N3 TaxID=1938805 RepID=UPI000E262944|nr:hypothetical protein [Paraburkholderia sp. BL27I4N3]REE07225.1 hypothetical protein B0G71_7708 [Paraburkholderia sp. BL27I4N3]
MQNLMMLLLAAGSSTLCACTIQPQAQPQPSRHISTIVIQQPRGEPGDFILCNDGRVLVFPVAHPKTCS